MKNFNLYLLLGLFLYSFSVQADSIINTIRYEGNEVTLPEVFDREIYIKSGDRFDEALIERSRQAIMDLELFKSVHYYLEENYTAADDGTKQVRIDVVFVVEEKYYILVIPRLKLDDDKLNYGVQLQWDNVFGLNHELEFLFFDRGESNGVDEKRNRFRYIYPNVFNSAYSLGLELRDENEVDESDGIVDRQDEVFSLSVRRWLNHDGRNHGDFWGTSVTYQSRFNDVISGDAASDEIDAFIFGLNAGFKDVTIYKYNRSGKDYGYNLDWSHDSIGSESEFTRHLFYYRSYYRLTQNKASNLNVQMKLGHSNNKVLGQYAFKLGSGDDLRGYENNRFRGNTMLLTNIEYIFPQPGKPVVRYVYFADVGNTYEELSDILHEPLNVGVGVGLRWKVKSFVKIDLRADVAYGFTDEDYKFSFGTRHAF